MIPDFVRVILEIRIAELEAQNAPVTNQIREIRAYLDSQPAQQQLPLDRPTDLTPLRDAARYVGRAYSTLRMWISQGALRSWKGTGTHPNNAPTLVSRSEVIAVTASMSRSVCYAHSTIDGAPRRAYFTTKKAVTP